MSPLPLRPTAHSVVQSLASPIGPRSRSVPRIRPVIAHGGAMRRACAVRAGQGPFGHSRFFQGPSKVLRTRLGSAAGSLIPRPRGPTDAWSRPDTRPATRQGLSAFDFEPLRAPIAAAALFVPSRRGAMETRRGFRSSVAALRPSGKGRYPILVPADPARFETFVTCRCATSATGHDAAATRLCSEPVVSTLLGDPGPGFARGICKTP